MTKSRKPQHRAPTPRIRWGAPRPGLAQREAELDQMAALFGDRCPDCGAGDVRELQLRHVLHAADLRPSQADDATRLLGAGVPGDSIFRACWRCDWDATIELSVDL
jgi:hypothetical protein